MRKFIQRNIHSMNTPQINILHILQDIIQGTGKSQMRTHPIGATLRPSSPSTMRKMTETSLLESHPKANNPNHHTIGPLPEFTNVKGTFMEMAVGYLNLHVHVPMAKRTL